MYCDQTLPKSQYNGRNSVSFDRSQVYIIGNHSSDPEAAVHITLGQSPRYLGVSFLTIGRSLSVHFDSSFSIA